MTDRGHFSSVLGCTLLLALALLACRKQGGGVHKISQTAVASDYKLTIVQVKECELNETEKRLLGEGSIALGVEAIIEPTGRDMAYSPTYASVSDSYGASYTGSVSFVCKPEILPQADVLTKHQKYRGWITFHVPAKAVRLKLTYQPFLLREQPVQFDLGR